MNSQYSTSDVAALGWLRRLEVRESLVMRFGLALRQPPGPRSVVLTVAAFDGRGGGVTPSDGLSWSLALAANFLYVASDEGARAFLSKPITFSSPVQQLELRLFSWPSRAALSDESVLQFFAIAAGDCSTTLLIPRNGCSG